MATPALSPLQAAYLRLLDNLEAFRDGDDTAIGQQFSRLKHPEHYTNTYVPSLDILREDVLHGKFSHPKHFYDKAVRCFTGVRNIIPDMKRDRRYEDSLSLQVYLNALWMNDINLPILEEVEAAFATNTTPVSVAAPLPKDLPPGVVPSVIHGYIQFIHTLASVRDTQNRAIGGAFISLPSSKKDTFFYERVTNPICLSMILDLVTKGQYTDPLKLYHDCHAVFNSFQRGSQAISQRWRNAVFMQMVLPKIWSIIPGLLEVAPVIVWKARNAKTNPLTAMPTYPQSKAVTSTAPVQGSRPALTNPAEPIVLAHPDNILTARPVVTLLEPVISAHPSMTSNGLDAQGRPEKATRMQTDEEITQIVAAPPIFLARMARAKTRQELQDISQHYTQDGSFNLLPAMFGQPQILMDPTKAEFSFPGLPYLLDIKFDEQSSGIRVNPNKEEVPTAVSETRLKWAERMIHSLVQHRTDPPAGGLYERMRQDLLSYSMDRHNQEIEIEVQASRSYLHVIQMQAIKQNFTFDLRHIFRQRAILYYRIWHEQALELLLADCTDLTSDPARNSTVSSQASAAAALLAGQVAILDITFQTLHGNSAQLASIFKTGMTASTMPLPILPNPEYVIPPDFAQEPDFRWPPYSHQIVSPEVEDTVRKIAKDVRLYNRLTTQARDFVLSHFRRGIGALKSDSSARYLLLAFLSFYPDHIGLHITLSCCYVASGVLATQAHLCRSAAKLSNAKGVVCVEALTNLAVAYMTMGDDNQAMAELKTACETKATMWEAISNMLFLMTRPQDPSTIDPERLLKARDFGLSMIQRMWLGDPSANDGLPTARAGRLLPMVSLADMYKLQSLYLTLGSLALEANRPDVALQDFARGVEIILCGPAKASSNDNSANPRMLRYTFRDLCKVISMHIQYIWLENSGTEESLSRCRQALLSETQGEYDAEKFRSNSLRCLAEYPDLPSSQAAPFQPRHDMLPLLLLLPSHVRGLGRFCLSVGQTNGLKTAPTALAETVDIIVRNEADGKAISILADLVFAICRVIEMCLQNPSPVLGAALKKTTGFLPSQASAINLYYFSISLKKNSLAMHNLAILCANVKPDYPATRVQMPTGKSVYTPYGFACAWIQQAGRTEPKVAISSETIDTLHLLRDLSRDNQSRPQPQPV